MTRFTANAQRTIGKMGRHVCSPSHSAPATSATVEGSISHDESLPLAICCGCSGNLFAGPTEEDNAQGLVHLSIRATSVEPASTVTALAKLAYNATARCIKTSVLHA